MVFAIVDIAGFQEKVSQGTKLTVPRLVGKEGEKVAFDQVLLLSQGEEGGVKVGAPYIAGALVEAKILSHGKGEKMRVYKMKHRKRYRRTQGHRQGNTEIEVTKVQG